LAKLQLVKPGAFFGTQCNVFSSWSECSENKFDLLFVSFHLFLHCSDSCGFYW